MNIYKDLKSFISNLIPKEFLEEAQQDEGFKEGQAITTNMAYANNNANLLKTHGRFKSTNMRHANGNSNLRELKRLGML